MAAQKPHAQVSLSKAKRKTWLLGQVGIGGYFRFLKDPKERIFQRMGGDDPTCSDHRAMSVETGFVHYYASNAEVIPARLLTAAFEEVP